MASAETYSIRLTFNPGDFLGECNNTQVEDGDLETMGICLGNFFSPVFPNPSAILTPITGARLTEKITAINFLSINNLEKYGVSGLIENIINLPLVLLGTILELIAAVATFLLVFAFKFVFVYLFYVSLGLQTLIMFFDTNNGNIDSVKKIHLTFWIMGLATIGMMTIGGGWIQW